mmetsp:Transcript_23080/g.58288  ORF Transcript_23080/g.58288 Transcript_23080/m.58288 type:complete len:246 (-) Transcript_23080:1397-2134(-)
MPVSFFFADAEDASALHGVRAGVCDPLVPGREARALPQAAPDPPDRVKCGGDGPPEDADSLPGAVERRGAHHSEQLVAWIFASCANKNSQGRPTRKRQLGRDGSFGEVSELLPNFRSAVRERNRIRAGGDPVVLRGTGEPFDRTGKEQSRTHVGGRRRGVFVGGQIWGDRGTRGADVPAGTVVEAAGGRRERSAEAIRVLRKTSGESIARRLHRAGSAFRGVFRSCPGHVGVFAFVAPARHWVHR